MNEPIKPRVSLQAYEAFRILSELPMNSPVELDGRNGMFLGQMGERMLCFKFGRKEYRWRVGDGELERIKAV